MSDLTVTLSTCCHNRSEHVKKTFLKNIEDNPEPYVRFLLVNYNSQDDLDAWARDVLTEYIQNGRLLYVHEKTAKRFKHAHARNVAIRACNTDVICNIDADNFTGPGFGSWLHQAYLDAGDKPVFTAFGKGSPCGDLFGRISFRVKHIKALGGYNEDLNTWGVEDWDIIKRADRVGMLCTSYPKEFNTEPLTHSQATRLQGTEFESPYDAMEQSAEMQLAKFGTGNNPNAKGQWGKAAVEVNWKRMVELPLSAGEILP